MEIKDIQKILEKEYDEVISNYRKTINCTYTDKYVEQAKIRLLERLLLDMFNVECEFDFSNIY